MNRQLAVFVGILAQAALSVTAHAAPLPSQSWVVTDPDGAKTARVTDNNLDTAWTSKTPQQAGMGLTVDLGKTAVIHRVYLNPGRATTDFPRSLRILAGP